MSSSNTTTPYGPYLTSHDTRFSPPPVAHACHYCHEPVGMPYPASFTCGASVCVALAASDIARDASAFLADCAGEDCQEDNRNDVLQCVGFLHLSTAEAIAKRLSICEVQALAYLRVLRDSGRLWARMINNQWRFSLPGS